MKKSAFVLITLSVVLAALLVACSVSVSGEASVDPAAPAESAPVDAAEGAPPAGDAEAPAPAGQGEGSIFVNAGNATDQLAIGTLYLQDTDTPITAEQAAVLIPLWEQLETAMSLEEIDQDAVNNLSEQIKAAMTDEQLAAIDALDPQVMFEWMQQSGLLPEMASGEMLEGGPQGGERPEGEPPGDGEPPAEMPEGEMPEGEGGPGGRPGGGGMGMGGTFMIDAVVEYLSTLV